MHPAGTGRRTVRARGSAHSQSISRPKESPWANSWTAHGQRRVWQPRPTAVAGAAPPPYLALNLPARGETFLVSRGATGHSFGKLWPSIHERKHDDEDDTPDSRPLPAAGHLRARAGTEYLRDEQGNIVYTTVPVTGEQVPALVPAATPQGQSGTGTVSGGGTTNSGGGSFEDTGGTGGSSGAGGGVGSGDNGEIVDDFN
jgi:uncharacterized membrane protein YgcG